MPEATQNFIRIPVGARSKDDKIRTITIDKEKGIQALYNIDRKNIATYLFARDKEWTMSSARAWISSHENVKKYAEIIKEELKALGIDTTWKKVIPSRDIVSSYDVVEDVPPRQRGPKAPKAELDETIKDAGTEEVSDKQTPGVKKKPTLKEIPTVEPMLWYARKLYYLDQEMEKLQAGGAYPGGEGSQGAGHFGTDVFPGKKKSPQQAKDDATVGERHEDTEKGGPGSGRKPEGGSKQPGGYYGRVLEGMRAAVHGKTPQDTDEHYMRGYESIDSSIHGKILSASERSHVYSQRFYGKKFDELTDLQKDFIEEVTWYIYEDEETIKGGPGSGRRPKGEAPYQYEEQQGAEAVYQGQVDYHSEAGDVPGKLSAQWKDLANRQSGRARKGEEIIDLQKGGIGSGRYAVGENSHGFGLVKRLHNLHHGTVETHKQLVGELIWMDRSDPTYTEKITLAFQLRDRINKIRTKLRNVEIRYPIEKKGGEQDETVKTS